MKRYNCTVSDKRGEFGEAMELSQQGEWVRFSEVERLIQTDELITALDDLLLAHQIYRGSAGSPKRIAAQAMGRLLKAEEKAKVILAKAKGTA